MPDMDFRDYIQRYSDPNRFQRQNKMMGWGAIGAALLSAPAKKNLAPGYMAGVQQVQQQQDKQRMMERMEMKDMMDVQKFEEAMRSQEILNKQREFDMTQMIKQQEAWQKSADYQSKRVYEDEKQKFDMASKKIEAMGKWAEKYGGAAIPQPFREVGKKAIGKVTEVAKGAVEKKGEKVAVEERELVSEVGALGPEALRQVSAQVGYRTPAEQEAYERDVRYDDLRTRNQELTLQINERALQFEATDPNYKTNVESYAKQIQAGVITPEQVPEQYRNEASALAILRQEAVDMQKQRMAGVGGGAEPPPEPAALGLAGYHESKYLADRKNVQLAMSQKLGNLDLLRYYFQSAVKQSGDVEQVKRNFEAALPGAVDEALKTIDVPYSSINTQAQQIASASAQSPNKEEWITAEQALAQLISPSGPYITTNGSQYYLRGGTYDNIFGDSGVFLNPRFAEMVMTEPEEVAPEPLTDTDIRDIKILIQKRIRPSSEMMSILNDLGYATWEAVVAEFGEEDLTKPVYYKTVEEATKGKPPSTTGRKR